MNEPISRVLEAIGEHRSTKENQWTARCPAHEDDTASLNISIGKDGKVLLHCFAGCDFKEVVAAIGLMESDLFAKDSDRNGHHMNGHSKPAAKKTYKTANEAIASLERFSGPRSAIWIYRTAQGDPLGVIVRWDSETGKKILPVSRRNDGWVCGAMPAPRPLYKLPLASTGTVYIAEGEKAADAIAALGLTATTSAGGSQAARQADWTPLAGREVIIMPDCDKAGEKYASDVRGILQSLDPPARVKIVRLPNLADGEDAVEFLERRHEDGKGNAAVAEELTALAREVALEVQPVDDDGPPFDGVSDGGDSPSQSCPSGNESPAESMPLTDLGNGRRFAREHGKIVRFCYPFAKWLIWDGKRWRHDDVGTAMALAKQTVISLFTWAKQQIILLADDDSDEGKRRLAKIKATLTFAKASQHVNRLRAMLELAKSEPGIAILPKALDADPWLFNVANGTLELRTGNLRPHAQADYLTKLCDVPYDATAKCPIFEATILKIFADAIELIEHVQRFFGYALTGETRDDVFAILFGGGSNGKSLLLKVILDLLGKDYAGTIPPELLMEMRGDSHPTLKADLQGKRLMVAFETGDGAKLNESRIKALTSIDEQKARRMREDYWDFTPTHKLLLCTNHRPRITGDDHGIWRRIALWPFGRKFWDADKKETGPPELKADKQLKDKLLAERPGILAWIVRGCLAWQRDGLKVPQVVVDAVAEYRSNEDRLGAFLAECCQLNREFRAKKCDVFGRYKSWAEGNGERVMTATAFGLAIRERGIEVDTQRRWYLGVALSTDDGE